MLLLLMSSDSMYIGFAIAGHELLLEYRKRRGNKEILYYSETISFLQRIKLQSLNILTPSPPKLHHTHCATTDTNSFHDRAYSNPVLSEKAT